MRGLTPAEWAQILESAGPCPGPLGEECCPAEMVIVIDLEEQGRIVRGPCPEHGEWCGETAELTELGREALRLWPEVRRFFGPDRSALPEAKS